MSYFDHVRCHSCKAMLDPEALAPGMACPRCGAQLSLPDLFGVSAALDEDESPALSLDDLVPASRRPSPPPASTGSGSTGSTASARSTASPSTPSTALSARSSAASAPTASRSTASRTSDPDEPTDGGALAAMRALKQRKKK